MITVAFGFASAFVPGITNLSNNCRTITAGNTILLSPVSRRRDDNTRRKIVAVLFLRHERDRYRPYVASAKGLVMLVNGIPPEQARMSTVRQNQKSRVKTATSVDQRATVKPRAIQNLWTNE